MRKKLLILGGGWSHIPAIRIANEMGLYTIVMDKNPKAPGLKICNKGINLDGSNKDEVFKISSVEKVNGILCTGDYSVVPAAYAAKKLDLSSIPYEVATLVTNKGKLFEKFRNGKISVSSGKVVSNLSDATRTSKEIGFPIILKPESSLGGSRGVIKVDNLSQLPDRYSFTKKFALNSRILIEKFLAGTEHTIESITINGKTHTLGISDKIRTTEPYCVATSLVYPSLQNKSIQSKIKKQAALAINSCGIKNGVTHIEAISLNNQVYLIDFGARGGAGGYIPSVIIPKVNGINMTEKMILLALGKTIGSIKPKFTHHVIYRFFKVKEGKITQIKGLNKIKKFPGLIDFRLGVKKGTQIKVLTNQLQRPGYFVVEGRNRRQVIQRAAIIEKTVQIKTI